MRNLEGKFLINKVAALPHGEIKPKIEKNYVSAYADLGYNVEFYR